MSLWRLGGVALGGRVALAALAALAPGRGLANDVPFGGAGAHLVPMDEPRVQMVSANVQLERAAPEGYQVLGPGHWNVRASYRFRNLTAESITVQIGSPEPACPPTLDCGFSGFEDMTTTVRGESTPLTVVSIDADHELSEDMERVHLFSVDFAPNETVEVVHTYRHGLTEHINGGEDLTYVTRTGTLWAGRIEEARFRIRLPFRPWGLSLDGWDDHLHRFEEKLVDDQLRVDLTFLRSDWDPRTDLRLYIGPGAPSLATPSLIEGCPAPSDLFEASMDPDEMNRVAVAELLGPLSAEALRRCRNAVYAHHGYDFTNPELNSAFYGESAIRVMKPQEGSGRPGTVFARNPAFSPAMLTHAECSYVEAIKRLEQQP